MHSLFTASVSPKSLAEQLLAEEREAEQRYTHYRTGRRENRTHPLKNQGIMYQLCGGGRRVLKKRIGGE